MKPRLTRAIICNLILLWAFSPVSLANAIRYDDPPFVKLSDGRIVPFGQGTVCTDECAPAEAIGLPDSSTSRRWVWIPIITTVALCAVLCRFGDPPVVIPPPSIVPNPTPTPRREVPPRAEQPPVAPVPEPRLLGVGGVVLLGIAELLRKKKSRRDAE